ncbi:hypothetical protein D3C73_1301820 [compost metagenome]
MRVKRSRLSAGEHRTVRHLLGSFEGTRFGERFPVLGHHAARAPQLIGEQHTQAAGGCQLLDDVLG